MTKHLKTLLTTSLLACASTASVAWDNGGVTTTINAVTILQKGTFYIQTDDPICDSGSNKIGAVNIGDTPNNMPQAQEGINMLLSIALTAQVTQSKVQVYADNSGRFWGCRMGALKLYK